MMTDHDTRALIRFVKSGAITFVSYALIVVGLTVILRTPLNPLDMIGLLILSVPIWVLNYWLLED